MNVRTTEATFLLPTAKWDANQRTHSHIPVHGTFVTEAHIVMRTAQNRYFNVTVDALTDNEAYPGVWLGWSGVTASCSMRKTRDPLWTKPVRIHESRNCDEITIKTDYTSTTMLTREFNITVIKLAVYDHISGPTRRLDMEISLRVPEAALMAQPHGIIGQGWDGTGKPRKGKTDTYPKEGSITTSAMAEGAIEGVPTDYQISSPYETRYKYSRFDAVPRKSALDMAKRAYTTVVRAIAGSGERKMAL